MSIRQRGFGLLEALLASALALMLVGAAGQLLIGVQHTWATQAAMAAQQQDARLVLQRLAQDIRMTGLSGCLDPARLQFEDPAAEQAFAEPIRIERDVEGRLQQLHLLTGELPGAFGPPDWTLLTDCLTWAEVRAGAHAGSDDAIALPMRQQRWRVQNGSLMLHSGGLNARLIDQVEGLWVDLKADGLRVDVRLALRGESSASMRTYASSVGLRNGRVP